MERSLEKYREIVGKKAINELYSLSENLKDRRILMVNSTANGGGVAEILKGLVSLMNELGIKTKWLVLEGDENFFRTTKKFHNSLQGEPDKNMINEIKNYQNFYRDKLENLNPEIIDYLKDANHSDIIVIHDPQPLGLIKYRKENGSKWIWRFHPDLSNPHKELWSFVENLANKYDKIIVSKEDFIKGDKEKYKIIRPSIDIFSDINREISDEEIKRTLEEINIPTDKPIICQVGRLDKWKDPIGVVKAYRLVKKDTDCRLVFVYNGSRDDPEGKIMHDKLLNIIEERGDKEIHLVRGDDPLVVNTMQRISSVILQKSIKEGFALTVSEALWKATPVIGTNVGGIPLQIEHGKNGYLVELNGNGEEHIRETADLIKELLTNKEKAEIMGLAGREIVKNNFLMTRHLKEYLELFNELTKKESAPLPLIHKIPQKE